MSCRRGITMHLLSEKKVDHDVPPHLCGKNNICRIAFNLDNYGNSWYLLSTKMDDPASDSEETSGSNEKEDLTKPSDEQNEGDKTSESDESDKRDDEI